MKKILITGVTGFIGSELAIHFSDIGYDVIGLKRNSSNLNRLSKHISKIRLINSDNESWINEIINSKPENIIHTAWEGVSASDRDIWDLQFKNIELQERLLNICEILNIKKFISLGSQAEYGNYKSIVSESHPIEPISNYGFLKNICHQIAQYRLRETNTKLFWLRLFPLFGEKESNSWFIPMIIDNLKNDRKIQMTPGEQKYAYLYINDLCQWIDKIISFDVKEGAYNISSIKNIYSLKEMVLIISSLMKIDQPKVEFGALPYRANQNMELVGSMNKLRDELGLTNLEETDFLENLSRVVQFKIKSK